MGRKQTTASWATEVTLGLCVSLSDAKESCPWLDASLDEPMAQHCNCSAFSAWGIARFSLSCAFSVPGQGWASETFHLPQTHASISPVPPYSREQPIFTTRAHVFQIDPSTKKNWVPASKQAVTVSYFYDSTRNSYRIISVDGAKVGG